MKYKVCILTAGTGSRLDDLTTYLNKSLVSVQNKPIISRIIDMFPKEAEFVIALGYKGNLVKEFLTLCYPDRKFYFCDVDKYGGEGSGVGYSLLACEKYLQEPFVFCSCDTLVTEEILVPTKNMVGYTYKDDASQYRTVEVADGKAIDLKEKSEKFGNNAYIGLACIKDYKEFWEEMHKGGYEAILQGESYALRSFARKNTLFAQNFTWFDTGNKQELEKTQEYFAQKDSPNILPKADEAIWFVDDKVIKFSNNKDFISQRVKRSEFIKGFIPEIIGFGENMYSYKKVAGEVLSKIDDLNLFKKLLNYSIDFWKKSELTEIQRKEFVDICNKFYKTKTEERIALYNKAFGYVDKEEEINNKKYPKLVDILEKIDWEWLNNGLIGRFHGDFHFENILYDSSNNKFTFLDWRQNFGGNLENGDIYYDLAKLLHGLIICHELIAQDKYNVEVQGNNIKYSFERKQILIDCERYYYQWLEENGYDIKKVKVLTALIYLNIAPLHHYPYCHLLYYLGKSMLFDNLN